PLGVQTERHADSLDNAAARRPQVELHSAAEELARIEIAEHSGGVCGGGVEAARAVAERSRAGPRPLGPTTSMPWWARAIEPPPAPIVRTSKTGTMRGRSPSVVSWTMAGTPASKTAASSEV